MTTAGGIGAIIGGVLLSRMGNAERLPAITVRSAIWVGLLVVAIGVIPSFWLATGAVFVLGIVGVICGVGLQVLLQKSINEAFRGRAAARPARCDDCKRTGLYGTGRLDPAAKES